MRNKSLVVLGLLVVMFISCNNSSVDNKTEALSNTQISVPDTIKLLGELYIGMTEQEVRDLVNNNPKQLYIQKLGARSEFLHVIANNIDYLAFGDTYKGKLSAVNYNSQKTFKRIDDPMLKEQYQYVYDFFKNANKYYKVKNTYFEKTQSEWPSSIGYEDYVIMAGFYFSSDILSNYISITLDQNKDLTYSLCVMFSEKRMPDKQPTLSKRLFE